MTVRELCEQAGGLPRDVGYQLAVELEKLGAARKEAGPRAGSIPSWRIDDDVIERGLLTPELIQSAAASVRATPPSAPTRPATRDALSDEEQAVRREQLRASKLRAEADALRAEQDLEKLRKGGGQAGGVDATTLLLLDRLNAVERKLEGGKGNGGLADAVKALAPALTLLLQARSGGLEVKDLVALLDRQSDAVGLLTKLRESGLLPPASADGGAGLANAGQLLDAVLDLVERAGPLVGKRREEGSVLEALERLGEKLGPEALRTVQQWIAMRERVERIRAGRAGGPAATTAAPQAVARLNEELIREAARLNDGFFPRLVEKLSPMFEGRGREFLAAIQTGQVGEAEAFETLQGVGFALTPPIRGYLRRFMNWLRAGARPQPQPTAAPTSQPEDNAGRPPASAPGPPPGSVIGQCAQCEEQYVYETAAIWEAEKGDPCARCGGRIERVTEVAG